MGKNLFTKEELEEIRRADAEIDATFRMTNEDLRRSRAVDREAVLERMDSQTRKIAAQQAAYYEANKDKIAAQKAAYREANKDKYKAYMRDYYKRRKQKNNEKKGAVSHG